MAEELESVPTTRTLNAAAAYVSARVVMVTRLSELLLGESSFVFGIKNPVC